MKTLTRYRAARLGFILALLLPVAVDAGADFAFENGEFACQVDTVDGGKGLVLIQTDSRKKAAEVALGADKALTILGTRSRATAVVECIRRPDERFSDRNFQNFFDEVPL